MLGFVVAEMVVIGAAIGLASHYLRRFPNARIAFLALIAALCVVAVVLSVTTHAPLWLAVVDGVLAIGTTTRAGYLWTKNRAAGAS